MSFANADMMRGAPKTQSPSQTVSSFALPSYPALSHTMNTMQARLANNTQGLDAYIQTHKQIPTLLHDTSSVSGMNVMNQGVGMFGATSVPMMDCVPGACHSNMYNAANSAMPTAAMPFGTQSMFNPYTSNTQSNVEFVPVETKTEKQNSVLTTDEQRKVCTSAHEMAQRLFSKNEQELKHPANMDKILKNHKLGIEQVDSKINTVSATMNKNNKQYKTGLTTHKNSMEELWDNCTKLKAELDELKRSKKKTSKTIDALDAGVQHHKATFEKMNMKINLQQLQNTETAEEHTDMISSLDDRLTELHRAVQTHAQILDEHHAQIDDHDERLQNKYQLVPNVSSMAPHRRR